MVGVANASRIQLDSGPRIHRLAQLGEDTYHKSDMELENVIDGGGGALSKKRGSETGDEG